MPVRVRAFLLHLIGSAAIALIVMTLVFKAWYPAPLHTALGVTHIFLLLLSVDVVLGPLLTLIVFKVGKKTLVFDLAVIFLLQLSALGYGVWTVAEGRPAWLVFNVDRFDVVQAVDIDGRKLEEARADFKTPALFGPRWVGAMRPQDSSQRETIMFESILYGSDIAQRPNLYRPLNEFVSQIKQKALPLSGLNKFNKISDVEAVLAQWPSAKSWLPLKARAKPMAVLLDMNAEVVAIVDLHPWDI
jgi:hypothetical protein